MCRCGINKILIKMVAAVDNGTAAGCSMTDLTNKNDVVRAVVGVTCVFSMVGSILIIFSYLCSKTLRSRVRLILVHLSLMDFLVAFSNFAGDVANFDQYYINSSLNMSCNAPLPLIPSNSVYPAVKVLCVVQAAVAHFSTLSSVLWTTSLAVYLYLHIVHYRSKMSHYSFLLSFVLCYGLPLLITVWALTTNRLGFSPYNTSGWCGPIFRDPMTEKISKLFAVVSYDLWIYLTMILVTVLSIGIRSYLADQVSEQIVCL